MPQTKNEEMIQGLSDVEFELDTGRAGGLYCPVCEDETGDGCPHLLGHSLGGDTWQLLDCWVQKDDEDEDYDYNSLDCWEFDLSRARKKKDAFLINEEWVPLFSSQCDSGGCGYEAWFAVPVSLFASAKAPTEILDAISERLAEVVESYED